MRNKNIKNYLKFFASLVKDINNPNEEKWFSDYRESNASSGIVNYLNMRLSEFNRYKKQKNIAEGDDRRGCYNFQKSFKL